MTKENKEIQTFEPKIGDLYKLNRRTFFVHEKEKYSDCFDINQVICLLHIKNKASNASKLKIFHFLINNSIYVRSFSMGSDEREFFGVFTRLT